MELREWKYIITIAEEGSISRAAEKLFMAQSSLSQFLRQYEEDLGTVLFRRTSQGVRLTNSGEVVVAHARKMLQAQHRLRAQIADIEGLQRGYIKLGIATFRGMYMLPQVLTAYYKKYPHVHVDIFEQNSMALEEALMQGELDIALLALPLTRPIANIEHVIRDEILIVANTEHPVMQAAGRRSDGSYYIALQDAAPYEFILGPEDSILGTVARQQFVAAGFEPIARNTNITAPFAAAMAREGLGLSFTYRSCSKDYPHAVYLSLGEEGLYLDLALGYPAGAYQSMATKALAEEFRSCLRATIR